MKLKSLTHNSNDLINYSPDDGLLSQQMKPYLWTLSFATLTTLLLALVAAMIGIVIGPSFKILSGEVATQSYPLTELVGANISRLLVWSTGLTQLTKADLIAYLPVFLISLSGLKALLYLFQVYLWELTGEKIAKSIRSLLIQSYTNMSPQVAATGDGKQFVAGLSSGLSIDIKLIKDYFVRFYGGVPRELLQVIFFALTLYLLSSRLFLIFFLGLLPVAVIIKKIGKLIRKRSDAALSDFSVLSEWIQQRLLGIETIKHYGTEGIESKNLRVLTEKLFYRFYKIVRAKAKSSPTIEAAAVIAVAVVIYISLGDVQNGYVTGAVVLSFLSTLAMMSQSISRLGRYYNNNREASSAIGRVSRALNFASQNFHGNLSIPTQKFADESTVLQAEKVSVSYEERETIGLDSFSYSFQRGLVYCICGKSGAGKSTFVNALFGLVDLTSGKISLSSEHQTDGLPITYVPQDIVLMEISIKENIAYPFTEQIDEQKIKQALEKVGMLECVEELAEGIDSVVGSAGIAFSGGQTQRLMLARIWYRFSPVVVIDEGTSALDPVSEQHIYKEIRKLADEGVTVIMNAHRMSALEFADTVILLKDGKKELSGPYLEIKSSPEFKSYLGE